MTDDPIKALINYRIKRAEETYINEVEHHPKN
jgi:hypothetical protein